MGNFKLEITNVSLVRQKSFLLPPPPSLRKKSTFTNFYDILILPKAKSFIPYLSSFQCFKLSLLVKHLFDSSNYSSKPDVKCTNIPLIEIYLKDIPLNIQEENIICETKISTNERFDLKCLLHKNILSMHNHHCKTDNQTTTLQTCWKQTLSTPFQATKMRNSIHICVLCIYIETHTWMIYDILSLSSSCIQRKRISWNRHQCLELETN